MTEHTKISLEGEVIIPKEVCEQLDWKPGMELEIEPDGGTLVLKLKPQPRKRITIEEFRRRVPPHKGPPVTLEEMEEAILKEAAARFERKTRRS